ncbi:hypothetical protein BPIT_02850 [Candidatus Brocadia pituitae]|nr:hypothetical protein BPIT_02850 [Candidatus Brocadia pituitae]
MILDKFMAEVHDRKEMFVRGGINPTFTIHIRKRMFLDRYCRESIRVKILQQEKG